MWDEAVVPRPYPFGWEVALEGGGRWRSQGQDAAIRRRRWHPCERAERTVLVAVTPPRHQAYGALYAARGG